MNVPKKRNVDCFQIVSKLYFTHNVTFRGQNVWLQKVAACLSFVEKKQKQKTKNVHDTLSRRPDTSRNSNSNSKLARKSMNTLVTNGSY